MEHEMLELMERAERLALDVEAALARGDVDRAGTSVLGAVDATFELVARWVEDDGPLDREPGPLYRSITAAIGQRPGADSYDTGRLLRALDDLDRWSGRPWWSDAPLQAVTARSAAAVAGGIRRVVGFVGVVDLDAPPPWPPVLDREVLDDDTVITAVLAGGSPTARVHRVLDLLEEAAPGHGWEAYRDLPFEDELARRRQVLVEAARADPPGEPIGVVWCGIFAPIRDGEATLDTYLWGGPRTLLEVEDWHGMTTWEPAGGYVRSRVMDGIHRRANVTGSAGHHAETPIALAYAASFAIEAVSAFRAASGTGPVALRAGFDGGGAHDLGDW